MVFPDHYALDFNFAAKLFHAEQFADHAK